MRNPWLAIDATTSPAQRARELRHAWERFLEDGRPDEVARADRRLLAALARGRGRPVRARLRAIRGRRRRGGRALGGPPAGRDGAADPRVPGRHRRRRGAPDGHQRRRRDAAVARGRALGPAGGRELDELLDRRAVERGRRGHERDRHRAGRRPRRAGVRGRALQRGRAGVDVRGGPRARSRHGRGARGDRPHEQDEHGPPALVRGRRRHGRRGRGAAALHDARAHGPPARALPRPRAERQRHPRAGHRHRARDHRPPRRLDGGGADRGPRRRRRVHAALRRARVRRAAGPRRRVPRARARPRAGHPLAAR